MKKQTKLFTILSLITCISIVFAGCKKNDIENFETLNKLYNAYKNGEICECMHNGQLVYMVSLNYYDADSSITDKDGEPIGSCNYAWGSVDSICGQLTDCEAIYRVKDNIWDQPAVDKYNLGK